MADKHRAMKVVSHTNSKIVSKMILLVLFVVLPPAGCSSISGTEKNYAQCTLDASSPIGAKFQHDFVAGSTRSAELDDEAYTAFLVTCMKAKGYKYADVWGSDGKMNVACWAENKDNPLIPLPFISGPKCFSRSLW